MTLPGDLAAAGPSTLPVLEAVARHEAAARWAELLGEHRADESAEEEELELETDAVRLFNALRQALPEGLSVVRRGEGVFLVDDGGMERTIVSLEQAFRVIEEWKESRSL